MSALNMAILQVNSRDSCIIISINMSALQVCIFNCPIFLSILQSIDIILNLFIWIIFIISEECQELAFSVLPLLFVGRSKGMKGRCTPAESLRSFIDMKPVSYFFNFWEFVQYVILISGFLLSDIVRRG